VSGVVPFSHFSLGYTPLHALQRQPNMQLPLPLLPFVL
jgi:hypothetical protein